MRTKQHIIALSLLLLLAAGLAFALPWKQWLEVKLKQELAARGVEASFTLDAIGFSGITLKDISLESPFPLKLDALTVGYSARELARGELRRVSADKLALRAGKIRAVAKDVTLDFIQGGAAHRWQGTWRVGALQVNEAPVPLPPLAGEGTFKVSPGHGETGGTFQSGDRRHHVSFTVFMAEAPQDSRLVVSSARLPWNEGTLSTREAVFPLAKGRRAALTLHADAVSLHALLGAATGDRARATGAVSGRVPVTIHGDGTLTVQNGQLTAGEAGTIMLAPDAIPGDNAQLGLLREVLRNFHYRVLTMVIDSDKDRKLSLLLKLEGNNPDAYGGKPVKLNVHLTGDVLSFLQQSVMPMTDPKQLMEHNTHAQP